ncbi:MAG: hypothetical protein AAB415_01695 [Patescibacteria group bacterium]
MNLHTRSLGILLLLLPIFLFAVFAGSALERDLNLLGRLTGDESVDQLAATGQPSSVSRPLVEAETAASAKLAAASRSLALVSSLNNQITAKISQLGATELKSLLVQRKVELLNLAKVNPRLFLTQKLSPTIIQKIPQDLRGNLEQAATLTGRLEVMHIDDFEHENSRYDYSLVVGNTKYALYPTEPILSASGAVMKVTGSQLEEVIVAEASKFQIITAAPRPEAVGDQKTLILLVNFLDSGPPPKTPQEIYDLTFNGQFQKFYHEQSYGKIKFTGDVKGWYTLPRNSGGCAGAEDSEVAHIILDNNIDLSKYASLVIVHGTQCPDASGYSTVGKRNFSVGNKNFNLSTAWVQISDLELYNQWKGFDNVGTGHPFSWTIWDHILSHEMGHGLGVLHANGWDCGENVFRGGCRHEEYGNLFDTMGQGAYSTHFNSFYKELLGWIPPNETIQINSSGRYALNPLELAGSGKKLAKVQSPLATSTTLYLEHRRGTGFDRKLNDTALSPNQQGLFINKIINDDFYQFPRLLDMEPTTLPWEQDISLTTLNSTSNKFTDITTGINLGPIITVGDSTITFDVELTTPQTPQCVRDKPVITSFYPYPSPARGGTSYITISYLNSDSSSCGDSNFRIETNIPSTWQPTISPPGDVLVSPADNIVETVGADIFFTLPSNTSLGRHVVTIDVINLNTNQKATANVEIIIVNPPTISNITPRSGPVGTVVSVSGADFSGYSVINFINLTTGNSFSNYVFTSDIRKINFTVPEFITNNGQQIPTAPGRYKISVYANGADSNPIDFEVTSTTTPTVTILSPNGGETIPRGGSLNIKWNHTGNQTNQPITVTVLPYRAPGAPPPDPADILNTTSGNDGQETIPIPATQPIGQYIVMVSVTVDGRRYHDFSDQPFTIMANTVVTPPETIPTTPLPFTVLAPNGGESWRLGTKQTISWLGGGSVNVSVIKATATSTSYLIGKQLSASNFSWTVGQGSEAGMSVPIGSYRLRVCTVTTPTVCDESDAPFTIIK